MDQRRYIFYGLLVVAGLTLALGFASGLLLRIHLGVDVALVGYVVYLLRTKPRRQPREIVTHYRPSIRRDERERAREREYLRAGEL